MPVLTYEEACTDLGELPLGVRVTAIVLEVPDGQAQSLVRAGEPPYGTRVELLSLTAVFGEIIDPPEQRYFPWDAGASSAVGQDLILVMEWTCESLVSGTTQVLFPADQLQLGVEIEGERTEME